jgi:hypothetical protein
MAEPKPHPGLLENKTARFTIGAGLGVVAFFGIVLSISDSLRDFAHKSADGIGFLGLIVGIVGLILSGLAVVFAQSASHAAERARKSISSHSLAEELGAARHGAAELEELLVMGKYEVARTKCSELLDLPTQIQNRWTELLTEGSQNNLVLARAQLDSIRSRLVRGPITDEEKQTMCDVASTVRGLFVQEYGLALSEADRGVHA